MQPVEVLDEIERDHRLEHGHFDVSTLAGPLAPEEGRQDGVGRDQSRSLVGGDRRKVLRLARLALHERGAAREALDDVVVGGQPAVRTVLPEAVQADVDQARVAGEHRRRLDAQRGELLGTDAVHENVGGVDQLHQRRASFFALEVEHGAALAAVDAHEDGAHASFRGRTGEARGVALGGLDLDDVRAVVGEDLARIGTEHDRAQVEHPHALQGKHLDDPPHRLAGTLMVAVLV